MKQVLYYQAGGDTKRGLVSQTTSKFNKTHSRLPDQKSAEKMNLLANMPIVHPPFLPPRKFDSEQKFTLVLDLDETLIHFVDSQSSGGESFFRIRPFCHEFLTELTKWYEIVIFTAGVQDYADWVLD